MKYSARPLLSVIIPVHNAEKYLEQCLDSVLCQTYGNLELILVDDGSGDGSLQICNHYAAEDKRVKVISQPHSGVVRARKNALSLVSGEVVTCVDADDWIEKDMYETLIDALLSAGADIATSGLIREYTGHSVIDREHLPPGIYDRNKENAIRFINQSVFFQPEISIHISNKIYNCQLFYRNLLMIPDEVRILDDAACIFPCLLEAERIAVTGNEFYHYRILDNNSLMSVDDGGELKRYRVCYKYLEDRFKDCRDMLTGLDYLMYYGLLLKMPASLLKSGEGYLFPYSKVRKGSKIIIYGIGRAGKALQQCVASEKDFELVACVDKNIKTEISDNRKYRPVSYLAKAEFDYIIIAVFVTNVADEIEKELMAMGICPEKIVRVDISKLTHDRLEEVMA